MKTSGVSRIGAKSAPGGWEPRWARFLYRRIARIYDRIRPLWSSRPAEAELDSLFSTRIGPTSRVLELAPGTGINLARLFRHAPRFGSYLGIDVSTPMLDRARLAARGNPGVTLQLGDATDLSRIDESFEFIVCTWLLSHLEHPESVVEGALEHLAPGGTAAFLFFTRPSNFFVRALLGLFVRSFRGAFVDVAGIAALPHLEAMHRYSGGYATLAVFFRPAAA